MSVAVVHLVRNGNPDTMLARFLGSYAKHPAGLSHKLVFVLKGFDPEEAGLLRDCIIAREPSSDYIEVSDAGYDITAYRHAARILDEEFIVFLNSHSEIEADMWLSTMIDGFRRRPDAGVIGATGSWESIFSDAPFPNAHIRTNAFAIRRPDFLSLEFGPLDSKEACHQFEAGARSMTRQLAARGLSAYVAGRGGTLFDKERWFEARTFRSGRQENLLIADNQTRNYLDGSFRHSRKVAKLSWGDQAIVPKPSFAERAKFFLKRIAAGRF